MSAGFGLSIWATPRPLGNEIVRRLCVAPLERGWVPGERAGYHPYTSWYVLGEIVSRLSGKPFSEYVRETNLLAAGNGRLLDRHAREQYEILTDHDWASWQTPNRAVTPRRL